MLLRGQRGTDSLSQADVAAGARLVLLDDAVAPLPMALEERGLPRHYRVGPARNAPGDATYAHLLETARAVGLRPFAPSHLAVRKEAATGDWAISWVRTARYGADSWEGVEVPLTEEREEYRLRVVAAGVVLREAQPTAPHFTYTAAMQLADGASGAVELRVAQLSTAVGYGPERVLNINV